jgi:hypothetical protein
MLLRKWDYSLHIYKPFESPSTNPVFYCADMHEKVDCANCGKTITVGNGLTSKTIHTEVGFGFIVCGECYGQEVKDERESDG